MRSRAFSFSFCVDKTHRTTPYQAFLNLTPSQEMSQAIGQPNHLEFESYISNYTGRTAIERAIFISKQCNSLEVEALTWAAAEIKKSTRDTEKYSTCIKALNVALRTRGQPTVESDQTWINTTNRENKANIEQLENELKGGKTMLKENTRDGLNRIGELYHQCGDLANALKSYVRSRDYCSNSEQLLEMCFRVIQVNMDQENYTHVSSYVARAEATPNLPKKDLVQAKLDSCRALVSLHQYEPYVHAANAFMGVSFEMNNTFNAVLSANDVAMYGTLCALASYSRQELRNKVLSNSAFKSYLELEPHMREMIDTFYNSKYASCLELLESYRNDFLLDIHLAPHIPKLFQLIREKAMVQYCIPFSTVDLNRMATAFHTDVATLQNELTELIGRDRRIAARIDSHQKILYAKKRDQRRRAMKHSMQAGTDYEKSSKALILRLKLLSADMIVK
ncbi:26S proteasome subunit RPN7-domain-containing protein [Zychaea mexicana]|uniref:26S proteasome subunit RPN7-domain-containing protein n=1 Tax=Zychaea mexicana TaxID=64656 RepID=UPI0022FEEF5A|nr:26S proteasome subunit RPN7-domain-containing protein [Zychaea mexicana]KAI9495777.1 26S proteasome subunit RPN7-domain-containing protein [Zychaea mexicana]